MGQIFIMRFRHQHLINPFRKIYRPVILLMIVFLSGVVGYVVIENYSWADSLYMTVITVATVGYGEVVPLSDAGRLFTSILILNTFSTANTKKTLNYIA
mgnify:CR=1 FL=1